MSKISCQEAMDALKSIGQEPEAYFIVEEFIKQVDDLMKFRNMTVPMLLRAAKEVK